MIPHETVRYHGPRVDFARSDRAGLRLLRDSHAFRGVAAGGRLTLAAASLPGRPSISSTHNALLRQLRGRVADHRPGAK
jgi:hypothetical protein